MGEVDEEKIQAFMQFGYQPFVCPAKREVGPMMIGILVAAAVRYIGNKYFELLSVGSEQPIGDEPLKLAREEYTEFSLKKRDYL